MTTFEHHKLGEMPIRKENTLEHKLSLITEGELVFLSDFPEYDSSSVCRVLAEKCSSGEYVKVSKGIYCKARMTKFGPIMPSVEKVLDAIARRDKAKILPSGNAALNSLGMSEQVPMRLTYLTSGSARVIDLGGLSIKLKRSVPKTFEFKGQFYALLTQALKTIGKDNLTPDQESLIARLLVENPESDTCEHDIRLMPVWMQKTINRLRKQI